MAKVIKQVKSSDGLKIYADSNGNFDKPALVFTHGFKLTAAVFDHLFEDTLFSSNFHLVRYDLRGQGRSGVVEDSEGHRSNLYADDFAAVCEAFDVHKPYTVGWSYGCVILSDIIQHLPPDYLSGSIYIGGPSFLGEGLKDVICKETPVILGAFGSYTQTAVASEDVHAKFTDMLFSSPELVPTETKWLWRGMMSSAPPSSYALALNRHVDPSALYALGKKGYPLHFIAGTEDQVLDGKKMVNVLKEHFTNLSVYYVEKGGHSVFHQNVEETIQSITTFVNENRWVM